MWREGISRLTEKARAHGERLDALAALVDGAHGYIENILIYNAAVKRQAITSQTRIDELGEIVIGLLAVVETQQAEVQELNDRVLALEGER